LFGGGIESVKITKIEVARGIHWVEVPDADLRVLCGCPADAIKHLIKRGLVLPQEVKGVSCETGPNAILLSDVALQNGEFANLAEFPVLQMLYKQGLIIPHHPNNTGRKPLLIGAAGQVASQVRYIYRGNYGLVSREEIVQAGVDEKSAGELMRLKLKFAFGSIKPTRDFIDARVLADGALEIAEGVTLRRIRTNVFEFSYRGETAAVDLNLKPGETYECPYPLGYRRFESEYFSVIHSGEGDGWDPDRPCMASILTFQGRLYLIDAGPNIAQTLAALGIAIDQVDGLFHTHAHDDHFAGITTLMKAGRRIRYYATPLVRASVTKKLSALIGMEEKRFADFFDVRDLAFDTWNGVDGLEVMPVLSPHPVETNILVFRAVSGNGHRTYAHFADIVSFDVLKKMVTDKPDAPGLDSRAFEAVRRAYLAPADLKKLDIGGGMIHGEARDFKTDASTRILLAHRAGDLTPAEKEIGSSASFGTVDVLTSRQSDFRQGNAGDYLRAHFPGVPLHDIQMMLNNPVTEINPGAIILKEGRMPPEVLLLVGGTVETICTRESRYGSLRVGSLIGDGMVLHQKPSPTTYRAASFVRVLSLPAGLYAEVIQRNGLQDRVQRAAALGAFLETTQLFAEGLPVEVFARVIDRSTERAYQPGDLVSGKDLKVLNIIRFGSVERRAGGTVIEVLQAHDVFGEEGALLRAPGLFGLRATEATSVLQIPGEILEGVPSLSWKLLDRFQQRTVRSVYGGEKNGGFVWRDELLLNVARTDSQHMRLVEIGNAVLLHLQKDVDRDAFVAALQALREYAQYHFETEEELMELYRYPGVDAHRSKHKDLNRRMAEYAGKAGIGFVPEKAVFAKFFETWLAEHLVEEDRKYADFLNTKGVY
jgi:hemerythrin